MTRPLVPSDLPATAGVARLLDVRDEAAFAAGHLPGAGHVPAAELEARRHELPERDRAVVVVADDADQARRAAETLEGMGFTDVRYLEQPAAALAAALTDRGPAARLWSPSPFLLEVADRLPEGRALDVAAGTCRNGVFLAGRGLRVEAVDVDPAALARGRGTARRSGARLCCWAQDLERHPHLPDNRYDVVLCFRFLWRPLFPALGRALRPGGHLLFETYRKGARRWPRPRRQRFLLEPGELGAAFPELETLHCSEPEPADAPASARLWARQPG